MKSITVYDRVLVEHVQRDESKPAPEFGTVKMIADENYIVAVDKGGTAIVHKTQLKKAE
jgi:hypothetical protein